MINFLICICLLSLRHLLFSNLKTNLVEKTERHLLRHSAKVEQHEESGSGSYSFLTLLPGLVCLFLAIKKRRARVEVRPSQKRYDYDVLIVGGGVGGHGAAMEAVRRGFKTAVVEGREIGGTCVNRGCVPSKALLASSGKIRELQNSVGLKKMGIEAEGKFTVSRPKLAQNARDLANAIKQNLRNSLENSGCDILEGTASLVDETTLEIKKLGRVDSTARVTAKYIILATGSEPLIPRGVEVDGERIFSSDEGLNLKHVPEWMGIIGSGYIGLEFSDVYTSLGANCTFFEALDRLMPGFDVDIQKIANRLLIQNRNINAFTSVFASVKPPRSDLEACRIELRNANTLELEKTVELDSVLVATGRKPVTKSLKLENLDSDLVKGDFVNVDAEMRVLKRDGTPIPNVFCIGDANGKMMLAHAASCQGIKVVQNLETDRRVPNFNLLEIPAACFTHPEIAFVGMTEQQIQQVGCVYRVTKTYFKGNTKALAENASDGMGKIIFCPETGKIFGCHVIGLHASDLIHEISNAIASQISIQELARATHAHPTVAEVMEELIRSAAHECR